MRYRIFLIVFCISLLAMSCSVSKANNEYAGKVNKKFIKNEDYFVVLQNEREIFLKNYNTFPSQTENKIIEQKAWDKIVEGFFIKDLFEREKIIVTNKEVLDSLRINIPSIVLTSDKFKNQQGKFDEELYLKSLMTNNPVDMKWLKQYYFTSYIPMQKLKKKVVSARKIPDKDLQDYFFSKTTSCDLTYFELPYDNFYNDIQISQNEIEQYYQDNLPSFENPAQCNIKWAYFPVKPNAEDSLHTKNLADSLYKELTNGSSFPILASRYSDGGFAKEKGSAGFIDLNTFPDFVKTILVNSPLNSPLKPVFYNDSYFIFQILERTQNMVKLQVIQLNIKPTDKTINHIKDRIKQFRELTQEIGFDNASSEYHIQTDSQDSLHLDNFYLKKLGESENVVRRCLISKAGTVFDPLMNYNLQAFIVFYVAKSKPRTLKKLSEVNDEIFEIIRYNRAYSYAQTHSENLLNKYKNVETIEKNLNISPTVINQYSWNHSFMSKKPDFKLEAINKGALKGFIYCLPEKILIVFSDKFSSDKNQSFDENKKQLLEELKQLNANEYFKNYMQKEKQKMKVKDFRNGRS